GREILYFASHADAFPLQQRKQNNCGDRCDLDSQRAIERGEQMRQVLADHDSHCTGSSAGGQPVAPAHDESGEIADGPAGKVVLAPAFWNARAEFCKLEGAHQRVQRAADPYAEEQPVVGQSRSDVSGSPHNAGGNRIAHRYGDAETHTQNLQQPAAFFAGGPWWPRGFDGNRVSRNGQCGVSSDFRSRRHHTFVGPKSKSFRWSPGLLSSPATLNPIEFEGVALMLFNSFWADAGNENRPQSAARSRWRSCSG